MKIGPTFLATIFIHPDATPDLTKENVDSEIEDVLRKIDNVASIEELNNALNALAFIVGSGLSDRAGVWARDRAEKLIRDIYRDRVRDIVRDRVHNIEKVIVVLDYCKTARTREELLNSIELKNLPVNFNRYARPLLEVDYIEMTHPAQPSSPNQRYRTTEIGKLLLAILKE